MFKLLDTYVNIFTKTWINSMWRNIYLWQKFGLIRYERKNPAVKKYWVNITATRKIGPGFRSCKKVKRCIRSFSASSNKVWIHPWSLCNLLKEWRCRIKAAVKPGTAKRKLYFCVWCLLNDIYQTFKDIISDSLNIKLSTCYSF